MGVLMVLALQAEPGAIRAAVERAIPLVEKSSAGFMEERLCFRCHHQGVPVLALATAREAGVSIDEENWLKLELRNRNPYFTRSLAGATNVMDRAYYSGESFHLQLERQGFSYIGRFSSDGSKWVDIGTHTLFREGGFLSFGAWGSGHENVAEFEHFSVRRAP